MSVRRTVALLALVGLVSAPAVAVSRCFCRYTGEAMDGCAARADDRASLGAPDCCDVVTRAPLDSASLSDASTARLLAPHAIDLALASSVSLDARAPARQTGLEALAPPGSPPPLARTGILLI